MDVNQGTTCRDFQRMWYYIKDVDACSQFWYGGCDGNGNRFSSENECLQACSSKRKSYLAHMKEMSNSVVWNPYKERVVCLCFVARVMKLELFAGEKQNAILINVS